MSDSPSLSPASVLQDLHWRYATKAFEPGRKIPEETWHALEQALVLTPSSFGLQPWKFIVIEDQELRAKLRPHAWNQSQVTDCSHFVVFATKTSISESYIDTFLEHAVQVQKRDPQAVKGYRNMMVGDLIHGARSKVIAEWSARQAYIALGTFMSVAAFLKIDTCPLEGFVPAEFDKILDLEAQGLTASVCCAAGFRDPNCTYAAMPKVRFAKEQVVERL